MLRQPLAIVLCCALVTNGCASASGSRIAQTPQPPVQDNAVLAGYVQRLPAGSKVRVERSGGDVLRGTLMNATADGIVVQKNTRVPEKPVEIPLADVTRVSLETGSSSVGKHIAIGIASGVAATFGVLLVLAAIWSD